MTTDARVDAARAVLAAHGYDTASVTVAGHDGGIAVIGNMGADRLAEVARLAPALRELGFRYITLDVSELS